MPTMQSRARFDWHEETGRVRLSAAARWLPARSTRAPDRALPGEPAGSLKPPASQSPAPFKWLAPHQLNGLLEGFCPEPRQEEQIAVNSNGLMLFLQLADIEWLAAADHGVELRVGKQTHRLRDTLAAVAAKLPADRFLRISPSTLVNIAQIWGLQRMFFDEYEVLLRNGARLTLTRGYCENLRQISLSLAASIKPLICPRFTVEKAARN